MSSAWLGGACTCFLRPGCINAHEEVDVVVLSIKLGLALSAVSRNAQQVSVLLVNNSSLVHQVVCSRQGSALFR